MGDTPAPESQVDFREIDGRALTIMDLVTRGWSVRDAVKVSGWKDPKTYYSYINTHGLRAQHDECMRQGEEVKKVIEGRAPMSSQSPEMWKTLFLRQYIILNGVIEDVCQTIHIDMAHAVAALDSRNEHYDPIFAREVESLEPILRRRAEDTLLRSIRDRDRDSQKNAWRFLQATDPKYCNSRLPERADPADIKAVGKVSAEMVGEILRELLKGNETRDAVDVAVVETKELGDGTDPVQQPS